MNGQVSGFSAQQAPQQNEGADVEIDKLLKKQDKTKAETKKATKPAENLTSALFHGDHQTKEDAFLEQMVDDDPRTKSKRQQLQDKQMQEEMTKLFKTKQTVDDVVDLSSQFQAQGDLEAQELKERRKDESRAERSKTKATKTQVTQQQVAKQLAQVKPEAYSSFTAAFTQYAFDDSSDNRKKLNDMRSEMLKEGLTQKQVQHFESTMKTVLNQHMMYDLKSTVLNEYFLDYEDGHLSRQERRDRKSQHRLAKKSSESLSKKLQSMESTGVLKGTSLAVLEKVGHELRSELESFVFEEVEQNITRLSLDQLSEAEYVEKMQRYAQAAQAAGFALDLDKLTQKVNDAIEDLGLAYFAAPSQSGQSFDESDDEPKKRAQVYLNQQELLEDKLRHLFMQQLMAPGLKSSVTLRFKIKKLQNGLIKLGVFTEDRQDQLMKEGRILAEIKLRDELVDGYREQATLEKRSGPAYKLIQSRRVFCLKHLKKCGVKIAKSELIEIRNQQNIDMGVFLNDQIRQLDLAIEVRQTRHVLEKRRSFYKVLDRLVAETPVLKGLLTSSSYLDTEQIVEDMA